MNYIKLNDNLNHLSLGNLLNTIKKNSINKSAAIQTEIFCLLFNIDNISDTTVNNYCTGYRAIGNSYKQIYLTYQKKYHTDNTILIDTINNLISIMEGIIHNYHTIKELNDNKLLIKLTNNMYNIAKNDIYVPQKLKKDLTTYLKNHKYYEALSNMLFFIILEKKQPLYNNDLITETIEDILKDTNISVNDLKSYIEMKFKEGLSSISSLKKLAKNNNPYALFELGNLEYNGLITGKSNYELAFHYHKLAATYNHPTSNWMLAHMILNKKIGSLSDDDINLAWSYLKTAESLNSISALNTIGLCYLSGTNPQKETNKSLAINYFTKAANAGYIYAYNNLGKIYEEEANYELAFNYYLKSADNEESWACNKVGEFYRQGLGTEKNLSLSFKYYQLGTTSPIKNLYPWNIYNLVKYFYLPGSSSLGIEKDLNKSIQLLESIPELPNSIELLLYIYYELYLTNKKEEHLTKVKHYLSLLNQNHNLTTIDKTHIENTLKDLSHQITLPNT